MTVTRAKPSPGAGWPANAVSLRSALAIWVGSLSFGVARSRIWYRALLARRTDSGSSGALGVGSNNGVPFRRLDGHSPRQPAPLVFAAEHLCPGQTFDTIGQGWYADTNMGATYSIAAVARRTGLNPDTIRAWERRYQLVEPRREPSGVRVYSDRDIVRLELARDATLQGHSIRHAAKLSNAALRRLVPAQVPEATSNSNTVPADGFISETLDAIRNYDLGAAQRALTAAALVMAKDDLALRVLAPLLRQVGEDWSAGRLAIAQEHAVSQIVRNVTGGLTLQNVNAQKTDPSMVFSTPPGESHEFGIMLGALIAVARGRKTMLLGPSLPALELARAARRVRAQTIVIGSVAQPDDGSVPEFLRDLDAATAAGTVVWVGGPHAAIFCTMSGVRRAEAIPTLEALSDRLRSPVT